MYESKIVGATQCQIRPTLSLFFEAERRPFATPLFNCLGFLQLPREGRELGPLTPLATKLATKPAPPPGLPYRYTFPA